MTGFQLQLPERNDPLERMRIAFKDHGVADVENRIGQRLRFLIVGLQDGRHPGRAVREVL